MKVDRSQRVKAFLEIYYAILLSRPSVRCERTGAESRFSSRAEVNGAIY